MGEYRYHLYGEVDLATAPQLRADLREIVRANGSHLLIDCAGLTFIDSSGIGVLLETLHDLAEHDRHMLIVNVAPSPRRSFEILGLTDLLLHSERAAS